ncbi:MAG: mechanosensitive ion channel [Planctomycetes bacterium]|nr:mechanosensitive ion channel [Planctomycetota bacterium]
MQQISQFLTTYGFQLIGAVLILVVGWWITKLISKFLGKILDKSGIDKTLSIFLCKFCYFALLTFVVIATLNKIGMQTTSFIVVIGAAGLAVGLALQGALSNFAAGILLLIFKPFKVGDFVELAGSKGTVKKLEIFNTVLDTPDNIQVVIPNSKVTAASMSNFTVNQTRRVDLTIGISYEDDIQRAKDVILSVLKSDNRVLKDPAPATAVSELANSSVNMVVRPWCKCQDYWDVYFDITAKVKQALDENHISIPYPQQDIHFKDGKAIELLQVLREERAHAHH